MKPRLARLSWPRRFSLAALTLLGAGQSFSQLSQPAPSPTVQTLPGSRVVTFLGSTPGWFVCDSLGSPFVAEMGWPGARGLSRLSIYSKASAGQYSFRTYRVGRPDPGAGQINFELSTSGAVPAQGDAPFFVGAFNAEGTPGAITPGILTLNSADARGQCRWVIDTRLLGFSSRRSFLVTETPGGLLTYQTFDNRAPVRLTNPDGVQRSTVPSLKIVGGSRLISPGQELFTFSNAGYTYTVRVARQGRPAGASVSVSRGGKPIQTERLTGYTYAVRR